MNSFVESVPNTTADKFSVLLGLVFVGAGLAFVHEVGHLDWLNCFQCRHSFNPLSQRKMLDISLGVPATMKLPSNPNIKIAELHVGGAHLSIRDPMESELFVLSQSRWTQLSPVMRKTVENEWISYKSDAQKQRPREQRDDAAFLWNLAHNFYENYANAVIAAADDQQMAIAKLDVNDHDYCGRVFTVKNAGTFHSSTCVCNRRTALEIKVDLGGETFLCVNWKEHAPFVASSIAGSVPMTMPTVNQYDAPLARSLTRMRLHPNQKFALTPNLDAMIPIN